MTELWDVTCYIGSHSVACYYTWLEWMRPILTLASRWVLDLPTLEGWKAELTWVAGYIPRWCSCLQSPIQVLTGLRVQSNLLIAANEPNWHHYVILGYLKVLQKFALLINIRVVKTAHSFWLVNRDQKDRLTGAAYAAPTALRPLLLYHTLPCLPVVLHSLQ